MHATWIALAQSAIGVLSFACFVLPIGYLCAWLADIHGFRNRSGPTQLLWSVVLGLPLATVLCVSLARALAPSLVSRCFFILFALGSLTCFRLHRRRVAAARVSARPSRALRTAFLLAGVLAAYPLLAVVDLQIDHRIFISTVMADWAVRVPIVDAALKSGLLPPTNPLSALQGSAPPLHYYYYWYVLCAQIARFAHITGRAALTASCVWAGYGLIAILFLALRYLLGIRHAFGRHCVAAVLLLPVIGLDILLVSMRIFVHREHPDFELEWWREDRTPSFLSTILYAPHHIAGMVFALAAFLLLVSLLDQKLSPARGLLYAALAGACFAATVGTSTYVAFLFAVVCLLWSVDLVRMREWRLLLVLLGCGLIALGLSHTYLHELLTTTSGNQVEGGSRGAAHFAFVRLRNLHYADVQLKRHHVQPHARLVRDAVRLSGALALGFLELGFFLFVFLHQLRRDLLSRRPLASLERATWILFAGIALPAIFLSSAVVSSANDLGMHAAILVRLILLLWAAPWVYEVWRSRRSLEAASISRKLVLGAAALTFVLGMTGQAVQLVFERFYLPLVETRILPKRLDTLTTDRLSYRLYDIQAAYEALDRALPQNAIVQFDPAGRMLIATSLYSNRQIAAGDDGCGTGFGGDHTLCPPVFLRLRNFFGVGPKPIEDSVLPLEDRGSIEEPMPVASFVSGDGEFRSVCRDLHLNAILVNSKDPEWAMPGSWVWSEPAIFSSATARAYLCPAGEPAGVTTVAPDSLR